MADVSCNGFVITLHLREEFELREGEVTIQDVNDQPVKIFGIVLLVDGEPRFCYPWEVVARFDAEARTIIFIRGTQLTQLHDGMVEVCVEQWRCGIAPEKVKRLEIAFGAAI